MPHPPDHPRYEALELLGEGGMGRVWRVRDREDGRELALKVLRTRSSDDVRRFEAEIRTLGSLRDPGVVSVHDAGRTGGAPFVVMDLVGAPRLDELVGGRPAGPGRLRWLVTVAGRVLEVLSRIHARGVVHGDLKPAHIALLPDDGEPGATAPWEELLADPAPRVLLLDFGLARDRRLGPGTARDTGGTPLYVAPERVGGAPADERSDLYSLGALLHHLAAGAPPFPDLVRALARGARPPPLHELPGTAVSEALSARIGELLAREPWDRPADAEDALARLSGVPEAGGVRSGPGPRSTVPRLSEPVFVGREDELERLRAAAGRAAAGQGAILRLRGPAGSGKTWLIGRSGLSGELLHRDGALLLRAAFRAGAGGVEALGAVVRGALEAAREGGDPAPVDADLLRAAGLAPPPGDGARSPDAGPSPEVVRERRVRALVDLLERAAAHRPLVIALEDLQHADCTAAALLARLERQVGQHAILLVVTWRPEELDREGPTGAWLEGLDGRGALPALDLGGLADSELARWVEAALRPRGSPAPGLLAWLRARAGGLPGELRPWLEFLRETGSLHWSEGTWQLRAARAELSPGELREARVASLPPEARGVLLAAAVLGPCTDDTLLSALAEEAALAGELPEPAPAAGQASGALRSLRTAGLLTVTPDGHTLAPGLGDGVLSAWLPEPRRRALHRRAAELLLARRAPELRTEEADRAARHLEAAGEAARAARLYASAGRRAAELRANRMAEDALGRALSLEPEAAQRARIAVELGDLHALTGSYEAAIEAYERAGRDAARAAGPAPVDPLELLDRQGRVHQRCRKLDRAEAAFRTALERAPDDLRRGRARLRLAGVLFDRGEIEAARSEYARSEELLGPEAPAELRVAVHAGRGLVEKAAGRPGEAVRCLERGLRIAESAGDVLQAATLLTNLANVHRDRGAVDEAIRCLERSIERRERAGDPRGVAICRSGLARIDARRGRFREARRTTERCLAAFEELSDAKGVLVARLNLADLLLILGQPAGARSELEAARELAVRIGAGTLERTAARSAAYLALQEGDASRAADAARSLLDDPALPAGLRSSCLAVLAQALLDSDRVAEADEAAGGAPETAPELVEVRLRAATARGDPASARRLGEEALAAERAGALDRLETARLHRELGRAYRELGPEWADRTEKHLGHALREMEAMDARLEAAEAHVQLAVYWAYLGEPGPEREHRETARRIFLEAGLPGRAGRLEALEGRT